MSLADSALLFERFCEFRLGDGGESVRYRVVGQLQLPDKAQAEAMAAKQNAKAYPYAGPRDAGGETRWTVYLDSIRFRLSCMAYRSHLCGAHVEVIDLAATIWRLNASRQTRARKRFTSQRGAPGRFSLKSDKADVNSRERVWARLTAAVGRLPRDCPVFEGRWWPGGRDTAPAGVPSVWSGVRLAEDGDEMGPKQVPPAAPSVAELMADFPLPLPPRPDRPGRASWVPPAVEQPSRGEDWAASRRAAAIARAIAEEESVPAKR
jgi:hypothetical protein